jgi:hypothetical protein
MNCIVIDWDSFWINIIAGFILLIPSILISIWLIPKFTLRLMKKRNKKYSAIKIGAILQELSEFLIDSPFREKELNKEHVAIFTKKSDLRNYRFITLFSINVFNQMVFPKIILVINDFFKNKEIADTYSIIAKEYDRIKFFRVEIERILAAHSLHIDDEIIQKVSCFCFDIKALEISYKSNKVCDDLLTETNSERTGVFGQNEIVKIYESLLYLIKDLIVEELFEYEITRDNN